VSALPALRILALTEYCCATETAMIASHLFRRLQATGRFALDVVAINHTGDPFDPPVWPGRVFPAETVATIGRGDSLGLGRFVELLGAGAYEIALLIVDPVQARPLLPYLSEPRVTAVNGARTVLYFSLDCVPAPGWISDVVARVDLPVGYTRTTREQCMKVDPELGERVRVIPPAVDAQAFFPIAERDLVARFRSAYFDGRADHRPLITIVTSDAPRKDIARALAVRRALRDRGRDLLLYLHTPRHGASGDIVTMAENFRLEPAEDYWLPHPAAFGGFRGLPIVPTDIINLIYNASDCVLVTSRGEGWCSPAIEALATGVPVVAPAHTSLLEILADGRGYLARAGSTPSLWAAQLPADDRLRPLADVDDLASLIERVIDGDRPNINDGYLWVTERTWDTAAAEWDQLLTATVHDTHTGAPVDHGG
jgi:glycosyltransferase involved in cell wall biosynthesis